MLRLRAEPRCSLLYGASDGGYYLLRDLESGRERRLFDLGGELIYALFSPDGRYVVAGDISSGKIFVTAISGSDTIPRVVARVKDLDPYTRPAGWRADGTIVVLDLMRRSLAAVPWTGGELRHLAKLPVPCLHEGWPSMGPDGRTIACSSREWESDVWVVDDFDPEIAATRRRSIR